MRSRRGNMPIGLYRAIETHKARDFIDAVNDLNDKLGKTNVQILHALSIPSRVLVFSVFDSLADFESHSEELFSAGLPEIARNHEIKLTDQAFITSAASNDPERTLLGKHSYVVLTGGVVKIGKMADVIASGSRFIEKIGPERLSKGIGTQLLRALSGNNLNSVALRVALPSIEATEEFIMEKPMERTDIADDVKEWVSNMTSIRRGVFKVKRKFGSLSES